MLQDQAAKPTRDDRSRHQAPKQRFLLLLASRSRILSRYGVGRGVWQSQPGTAYSESTRRKASSLLAPTLHRNRRPHLSRRARKTGCALPAMLSCWDTASSFFYLPVSGTVWSRPNEIEISHGRVSWQTRSSRIEMGPLASSIR